MTLLLHQKEPFRVVSGHCGDETLSLTLESTFLGAFPCPEDGRELPTSGSPLLHCQLLLPQGR